MAKEFAFMALITCTLLNATPLLAAGNARLDNSQSVPNGATITEDVPLPLAKPEIGALAFLHTDMPPLPLKRPIGIQLPPHPLATGLLDARDFKIYKDAFAAADLRQWNKAQEIAARAKYRLPAKIIDWRYMSAYRNFATFDQIAAFIDSNPDWPLQQTLRRRAEEALSEPISTRRTLDWFSSHTPLTGIGMYRYGEALLASARKEEAVVWIRQAWHIGDLPAALEKQIVTRHSDILRKTDHEQRLDHLLWEREATAAKRMFRYVSDGMKKLAIARISLMRRTGNVDKAVREVPAELRNHPGLVFERTKWRRRKALDEESRELLLDVDESAPRADIWWQERHIQARNLLSKGHITEAYNLASQHGLQDGADFAAAEFLAGWISLRFLGDGEIALQHFIKLYENVSYPISRARGAYWIGRAKASLGDTVMAKYWYDIAARNYTTYYGQMALHELGQRRMPSIPVIAPVKIPVDVAKGEDEQILIVHHLAELGMPKWARPFLLEMAEKAKSEEDYVTVASLAERIGRPDFAIAIAKRASQLGTELTEINWPTPQLAISNPPIEPTLMLAITRQESAFASDAISWAGARGLMQLMPGTARAVSRQLKVSYSEPRLTADPTYNALLGSSYLAGLIEDFNGSYVLAIAAYNAGPSNVRRWLKEWGDPRAGDIDMIDWIEFIPFSETRNYVQRVIENLQVYRERLARDEGSVLRISEDINRGIASH
ncbi:MAG: lytic murein transglycosylase [Sneathiella sp.]|uniref:lytic transglycosylase domain-containing protein n=1 Tax=Sneathiella sp. TaxID=1964365 RepID=UPI000C552F9D|nr:transglycosylase SLT domain-containing protein [Sneathiella sp.]MAZ02269.1 lytic murein transglycosylase [Sneathiella sp.]